MGFQVGKPVPFIPVADISTAVIPGQAVGVTMDGGCVYSYVSAPISTVYDIGSLSAIPIKRPFQNTLPYRNNIYPILFNSPEQWVGQVVGGAWSNTDGVAWGFNVVYNTEFVKFPMSLFRGIIPVNNTNNGTIITDDYSLNSVLNTMVPALSLGGWFGSLLGSYTCPWAIPFGANTPFANYSYPLVTFNRKWGGIANIVGTTSLGQLRVFQLIDQKIGIIPSDVLVGISVKNDISEFYDTGFSAAASPLSDVGVQRNYNFQQFDGMLFVGCVGTNGAGTNINPVTGFTDLAGTSQNPPFVFALGQASAMLAAFPPSFAIGATNYSGPTMLRALTMSGNDLYAVVNYTLPDPSGLGHGSHVLMQLGYFLTLNIFSNQGSYNWKRSLQYGIGKYTIQNGQVMFLKGSRQ